jgi:hypothetical protein
MSQLRSIFPAKPTSSHSSWKTSRFEVGGINNSPTNFTSTCFYLDFHAKQVDVNLARKIIMKSTLNAQNNHQTYHRPCRMHCCLILHCCCRCFNLSLVRVPLLVALPLLCTVVSLLCLLILVIPLYSSTNNTSWIDYYYLDDVDTTDALIGTLYMVLVCFVFHMVDGVNVAMHLALTLLKLKDCASNMATRSQLAAWMDAVIRAFHLDFAKYMEPTVVAMSSIVQRVYSRTICANLIIF